MAEKCLKAILVYNKKPFPKTHDLLKLESLIIEIYPDVINLEKEMDLLSTYYIETRYPGDYPEFTLEEARMAFEAAKRIKGFVMDIIGKKKWYFAISLLVIIPGLISLLLFGLKLSIDFTGGSRLTLLFPQNVNNQTVTAVKQSFTQQKVEVASIQPSSNQLIIRTAPLSSQTHAIILQTITKEFPKVKEETYETVGPTIGNETTSNAVKGVLLASVLIVLYIAWAFREVPKPASSWRFGICAIIALLHDVLVVVGIFSILGHFFNVEVDSLFVTALLTVIGFSVHDTIVVFDRIRENLKKNILGSFDEVVNDSILQTMTRSLNTSLTVVLVLFTLLLFGGESTKWFIAALLIGVVSGTYSSIFNASQLLVVWHDWSIKRKKK